MYLIIIIPEIFSKSRSKKNQARSGKFRWEETQAHLKNRLSRKGVMYKVTLIFMLEVGLTAPSEWFPPIKSIVHCFWPYIFGPKKSLSHVICSLTDRSLKQTCHNFLLQHSWNHQKISPFLTWSQAGSFPVFFLNSSLNVQWIIIVPGFWDAWLTYYLLFRWSCLFRLHKF